MFAKDRLALVSPAIGLPPLAVVYHRYCPFMPPQAEMVMAELHELLSIQKGVGTHSIFSRAIPF